MRSHTQPKIKKMFIRNYTVKGSDVNDFMVMQNFAYLHYSTKLVESYLLEKGYSQQRLNSLELAWQKCNDRLTNKSVLMFTQKFEVQLNFADGDLGINQRLFIDFYNSDQELVASLQTELCWFNHNNWELVHPPKRISNLFAPKFPLRQAV